jgi:hypothetical protein
MGQTINLGDKKYERDDLSNDARATLVAIKFIDSRIEELTNIEALLQRAKNSYIDSLKKEMLSNKAGYLFGTD